MFLAMTPHLIGGLNDLILIEIMATRLIWCVKGVFRSQGHTYTMTGHPPVPKGGLVISKTEGMGALSLICGQDERNVSVLDHAQCQSFHEGIIGCV